MLAALIIAVSILPQPDAVLRDRCDLIEINHYFSDCGKLVFDQAIFYDWSESDGRYHVRAWRLVKSPAQLPQRDWFTPPGPLDCMRLTGGTTGRSYSSLWLDGEVMRRVETAALRETWTQWDVELAEREILPKENRREFKSLDRRSR
jgi:hypothetical protein